MVRNIPAGIRAYKTENGQNYKHGPKMAANGFVIYQNPEKM